MKKTILKYGAYSLLTAAGLFLIALLIGKSLDYSVQEVIGYVSMALSLIFVFFGIRHYRDNENEGKISFGKALLLGLLISLFAGIGFGIIDYIYTTAINPDFAVEYETKMLADMKATLTPAEYETQSKVLKEQMAQYGGSGFMAFIMFATVLIMGFVISLISGLILQRK
ncbi:DUF4199 domain-containing protein [Aureisphaera galaxeae]|uniref:DUF4199 domain-containing protein n=1 Tax=Aureisphaera galaxeae TaxID=1538023 RepID=UPI00234FD0A7|nr:DUF4199 domain-containing protein [Aureisphaera galaxeae]MDC8005983.1 DUF4199 domain-containing protein [Aureisphaera galaxeae]